MKVVCVHKANVLQKTDGLFARVSREVALSHREVSFSEMYVDAAAMNLIRKPEDFDVILTSNLYGDILSDEAAQLVGGLGVAPSANLGEEFGLFEPVHGSAPDIAGKGIANPLSMILSGKMMLEWLGQRHEDGRCQEGARLIEASCMKLLSQGVTTPDLGGTLSTEGFGGAVAREVMP